MQRKKLPIGIQTFAHLRKQGCYYVDKTGLALALINQGTHYFLSRPRRFGKSLFLDTLKELFEGNETLFHGLAVYDQWDWSVKYPVLRFSFGIGYFSQPDYLYANLMAQLDKLEEQFSYRSGYTTCPERFQALIRHAHEQTGQPVVILIDEYDKPILDALNDPVIAKANRDFLRGFYGTIKDYEAHIKFSFLTGVSKFAKVSLFSGLNNLKDITLDARYSAICGYTDHDIDTVFAAELGGLERDKIRHWYNGYNWLGAGVYNPYDVLNLFDTREFSNYWFESGAPSFLVDFLIKRKVSSITLDNMLSSATMLSSFDVDYIATEALLFQSGYLTIQQVKRVGSQNFYVLGYPNLEVRQSLNEVLLSALVKNQSAQAHNTIQLYDLLLRNDFDGLKQLFQAFYASIPYNWYSSNTIQEYEGYYASVFYSYFAALGLDLVLEDVNNHGRLDMALRFNGQVYLFEFKVVEEKPTGEALKQIHARGYADKYRALNQPLHLIGVEFGKQERNIIGFEVVSLKAEVV